MSLLCQRFYSLLTYNVKKSSQEDCMKNSERRNLYDKEKRKLEISKAASDLINGFKSRYTHNRSNRTEEFKKHEAKFTSVFNNYNPGYNRREEMAKAFVDCLLDDFREVRYGSEESIFPISIIDVLCTIDGREIERPDPIDRYVYNIARSVCTYYITQYTELSEEKKDPDGPKFGDFLIAIGTLKTLASYRDINIAD